MKKIFIHAGFAKCASTSFQEFMLTQRKILYPLSGINGAEHLSLPLKIKGVDEYTLQFFSDEWVRSSHEDMMMEIASATQETILLSSERLADLGPPQLLELMKIFSDYEIEFIFITRPMREFLDSTWRHIVFWHDYAETLDLFLETNSNIDLSDCIAKFRSMSKVHVFDLNDVLFQSSLSSLLGIDVSLGRSNAGASSELASFLQLLHHRIGSTLYKSVFTDEVKVLLRDSSSQDKSAFPAIYLHDFSHSINADRFQDFDCILQLLHQLLGPEGYKRLLGDEVILHLRDAWYSPMEQPLSAIVAGII
jgi:hypothetical protein